MARAAPDVWIHEVGPRDGLQSEPEAVASELKLGLVARLAAGGVGDHQAIFEQPAGSDASLPLHCLGAWPFPYDPPAIEIPGVAARTREGVARLAAGSLTVPESECLLAARSLDPLTPRRRRRGPRRSQGGAGDRS